MLLVGKSLQDREHHDRHQPALPEEAPATAEASLAPGDVPLPERDSAPEPEEAPVAEEASLTPGDLPLPERETSPGEDEPAAELT